MKRIEANFLSSEEKAVLLRAHKLERDGRKKDRLKRKKDRLKFILHANEGWSYERIATALFLDDQTLRNYWEEYKKGGVKSLLTYMIFREEATINAKSTAMLILDIMDKYKGAKKIHIILDNAGYNRAKIMQLLANHSRINLIYLPTYCPNLNLIERMWKFLHIDALLFSRRSLLYR